MKRQILSFVIGCIARLVASTLRLRVVGEDNVTKLQSEGKGLILVTWHGRTFIPLTYFRGRGYWSMISTSRDGEIQDRIFRRFGFNTVRGSTSARGAVRATLALAKQVKAGEVLALTPDGPRGPMHHVQLGTIYFAVKSGCPIVVVGSSASPRFLIDTWDRYLVPALFGRAALVFSEPIYIPEDAKSEEAQQQWAQRVGEEISRMESKAEQMVGSAQDASECRPV